MQENFYDFDELRYDLERLDLVRELLSPVRFPKLILTKDGGNSRELPLTWYCEVSEVILKLAKQEKERIENKLSLQLNRPLKLLEEYSHENYLKILNKELGMTIDEFNQKFNEWKNKQYEETI